MCPLVAAEAKKEREKEQRTKNKQKTPGIIVLPKNLAPLTPAPISDLIANNTNSSTNVKTNTLAEIDTITKDISNIELQNSELSKKLKKLRKKIREIEAIQAKLKSGELKKPDKDQLEKVKKRKEILKEIKLIEEQVGEE